MTKILVTGGAGFIGSHLVDALVARGDDVVVLDDLSTGKRENLAAVADRISLVEGSVTDARRVMEAADGVSVIFHLAAVASVQRTIQDPSHTHEVNVTGTVNVLETARQKGISKVVYASSCAVYGDDPELPKQETSRVQPKSPYALHKRIGEEYAAMFADVFGVRSVALRFFNVYGARQDASSPYSGVISIFSKKLSEGEEITIFGDGNATRDFIHVSDVVAALVAAAESDAAFALFNIGTGVETSLSRVVDVLGKRFGVEPKINFQGERAGDIRRSVADASKAQEQLRWKAKLSFVEGIALL